jgi:hypothetical protein
MAKRKRGQTNKSKKQLSRKITKQRPTPPQMPEGVQKSQKTGFLPSSKKEKIGWFLAILAICSFLFGVHKYYPRVSIEETALLQSNNPFYLPFEIKNTGNIRVIDFSYDLYVVQLFSDVANIGNTDFPAFSDTIPKIKVNGRHQIDLFKTINMSGNNIKGAEVFIRYKYSIPILKIPFRDSTRFVLLKDSYNAYKWKEFQY